MSIRCIVTSIIWDIFKFFFIICLPPAVMLPFNPKMIQEQTDFENCVLRLFSLSRHVISCHRSVAYPDHLLCPLLLKRFIIAAVSYNNMSQTHFNPYSPRRRSVPFRWGSWLHSVWDPVHDCTPGGLVLHCNPWIVAMCCCFLIHRSLCMC